MLPFKLSDGLIFSHGKAMKGRICWIFASRRPAFSPTKAEPLSNLIGSLTMCYANEVAVSKARHGVLNLIQDHPPSPENGILTIRRLRVSASLRPQ